MKRPSDAQVRQARRLLAHEGAAGSADACAAAASLVYGKLDAQLTSLMGAAGVSAVFARSVKLTQREFPMLEDRVIDGATNLRACLQVQEPTVAMELAAVLFGTFLTLIVTFIGEPLTTQLLRRAWPTLEETQFRETDR